MMQGRLREVPERGFFINLKRNKYPAISDTGSSNFLKTILEESEGESRNLKFKYPFQYDVVLSVAQCDLPTRRSCTACSKNYKSPCVKSSNRDAMREGQPPITRALLLASKV